MSTAIIFIFLSINVYLVVSVSLLARFQAFLLSRICERAYQLQREKLSDPSEKFSEVQKTFVSLFSKISLGGPGLALQAADSVEIRTE
jgi:hypothetical protein